jgi:hypothetical protein
VTSLPAEAFDFGNRHALNALLREGFLYLIEFKGFDDGFNFFHNALLMSELSPVVQLTYQA